jgi:hypothetical protein
VVGDVRSISAFNAVADKPPNVCGVLGVSICRDSLGRLGGEECRSGRDMTDEYCLQGATNITLIRDQRCGVVQNAVAYAVGMIPEDSSG